jgi:hypothetical protein
MKKVYLFFAAMVIAVGSTMFFASCQKEGEAALPMAKTATAVQNLEVEERGETKKSLSTRTLETIFKGTNSFSLDTKTNLLSVKALNMDKRILKEILSKGETKIDAPYTVSKTVVKKILRSAGINNIGDMQINGGSISIDPETNKVNIKVDCVWVYIFYVCKISVDIAL